MVRLILTQHAVADLGRFRCFLEEKDPRAARRAAQAIRVALKTIEEQPEMGRVFSDRDGLRELVISYGRTGYVALYRFDKERDQVTVLASRHQREAGFD